MEAHFTFWTTHKGYTTGTTLLRDPSSTTIWDKVDENISVIPQIGNHGMVSGNGNLTVSVNHVRENSDIDFSLALDLNPIYPSCSIALTKYSRVTTSGFASKITRARIVILGTVSASTTLSG